MLKQLLSSDDTITLLCIDVQIGFQDSAYWGGGRNNPNAEAVVSNLQTLWRRYDQNIIHVQHASKDPISKLHPNHPGFQFHPLAKPINDETILTKSVNSAFIGTSLHQTLQKQACNKLFIIGLTTDHCVSTTTRMAGNLGYETFLIPEACATFDKTSYDGRSYLAQDLHDSALASLHNEFATVIPLNLADPEQQTMT